MNEDISQRETEAKAATKLQQEVDFLLKNINERAFDLERIEDSVTVSEEGVIQEVSLGGGIEIIKAPRETTYEKTIRPLTRDVVLVKEIVTEKISQTFTKEKMNKGFAAVVGPVLYTLFRKIEE